jgi:predicted DNA-binding transcriptional regulator AlpA
MTARKRDIPLASRLTAYVSRETGAAELQVSPSTWDEMVESGHLPKPVRLGRTGTILRWRCEDIDSALRGTHAPASNPEPYFRERANHGQAKEHKRDARGRDWQRPRPKAAAPTEP